MTRTQPIDASWAVDRLHRSDRKPRREDELNATHILADAHSATEDRVLVRSARYIVRFGLDDDDREVLLYACGLTWDLASPVPGAEQGVPAGHKVCRSCRQPKPVDEFPRRKHHARRSVCRACETAGEDA